MQDVYTPLETDVIVQLSEVSSGAFISIWVLPDAFFPLFVSVLYKLAAVLEISFPNFFPFLFVIFIFCWNSVPSTPRASAR